MNLNDNPTKDQLATLLAACDDRLDHVLWVARDGEVSVTPRAEFERTDPDAQVTFDYFETGHAYTGPGAAKDAGWVEDLFVALTTEWPTARGKAKAVAVNDW